MDEDLQIQAREAIAAAYGTPEDSFDFTLAGQVTDSVICVIVDGQGTIESVLMES